MNENDDQEKNKFLQELQKDRPLHDSWLKRDLLSKEQATYIYYGIEPLNEKERKSDYFLEERLIDMFDTKKIYDILQNSFLKKYNNGQIFFKCFIELLEEKGIKIPEHFDSKKKIPKEKKMADHPIFGAISSKPRTKNLAFVLMPFNEKLKEVFTDAIQPAVESMKLICKRADDFNSNKTIIQDIFQKIFEAKIIIADLTQLNPNVMYEVGIAHALGKDTILIYQKEFGELKSKFPFDLSHIRRIEYENSIKGGNKLKDDLTSTLTFVLTQKDF